MNYDFAFDCAQSPMQFVETHCNASLPLPGRGVYIVTDGRTQLRIMGYELKIVGAKGFRPYFAICNTLNDRHNELARISCQFNNTNIPIALLLFASKYCELKASTFALYCS